MSYSPTNFNDVLASCQLDFPDSVLDSKTISRAFDEADCDFGYQGTTIFGMCLTLWAFLYEMFHTDKQRTLQAAVHAVQQKRIAEGLDPNSANTGTYSAAREKLDTKVPLSLMKTIAQKAEESVPEEILLCGRHISDLDGSSNSMSDPEENQEKYPQPKSQKAGLGFPLWRVVMLISAITGMVQMVAMGPWRGKGTGEMSLFVSLFDQLKNMASQIEVIVADKYYCCYHLIAMLAHFNILFVTRLHGSRFTNFADRKKVKRLKNGDFLVTWVRPARPFWMKDWMWKIIPETMTLRLVRVQINVPGSRSLGFFVVTNLLDTEKYPSEAIRKMYQARWQIEVDFRTIKTFMHMDILRGKTPEMVEKEFAVGLLAYNIVRAKMLETAILMREEASQQETKEPEKAQQEDQKTRNKNKIEPKDMMPRNVSFSVALASLTAAYVTVHFMTPAMREVYREQAHLNRQGVQVGNRPDRVDPRCVKRRGKAQRLMMEPREVLREQLLQRQSPTQDGDDAAAQLGEAP